MRTKWFLLAFILVVLPAAILSLLAARTIGYHELIMQTNLKQDAERLLSSVDSAVHDRSLHALEMVRITLAGAVTPATGTEQLGAMSRRLVSDHAIITDVMVFMNPWGFLSDQGSPTAPDEDDVARDLLVNTLRTRIASADLRAPLAELVFCLDQRAYYFAPMPGTASMWAGYAADRTALARLLRSVMDEHAANGMVLSYVGGPMQDPADNTADVIISDSLSTDMPSGTRLQERGTPGVPVLASTFLMPPLDQVELLVQAGPGVEIQKIAAAKTRLYAWGLGLVIAWVLFGIMVVLRQTVIEIHQARQRGEFLLGVSHDLRTPLASMRMLAESLAHGHVRPKEQPRFLETIVSECDRLNRLIARVLYLVRYGQGALVYCRRQVDLGEVAQKAVAELKTYANSLQLRIAPDLPPLQGDRAALEQVALNLLDNAVKYGTPSEIEDLRSPTSDPRPPAPVRVEVAVAVVNRSRWRWGKKRPWVCLSVRDFGMGIAKREHRKIFQRFYRSDRAHDRNVSGVGLGLALCRHVIRSHGGWIEVESSIGEGTTFRVYLRGGGR